MRDAPRTPRRRTFSIRPREKTTLGFRDTGLDPAGEVERVWTKRQRFEHQVIPVGDRLTRQAGGEFDGITEKVVAGQGPPGVERGLSAIMLDVLHGLAVNGEG